MSTMYNMSIDGLRDDMLDALVAFLSHSNFSPFCSAFLFYVPFFSVELFALRCSERRAKRIRVGPTVVVRRPRPRRWIGTGNERGRERKSLYVRVTRTSICVGVVCGNWSKKSCFQILRVLVR
jgi:hypothetical protein